MRRIRDSVLAFLPPGMVPGAPAENPHRALPARVIDAARAPAAMTQAIRGGQPSG